MAQPTAQEVLMWALINRARLNPAGEGIDVNEGLAAGTLSTTSRQPLAFNTLLEDAANLHSTNMINRDFFAHVDPLTGKNWQNRTNDAGYAGSALENISWKGTSGTLTDALATQYVYDQHASLFVDDGVTGRGHRVTMLNDSFQEVGVAQVLGAFTYTDKNGQVKTANTSMITQDFGRPSTATQFLTGITYNDTNKNAFYDVGEARGGVTVTTTAGNVVSGAAGAFSKAVNAGVQTISFSGAGLPQTVSAEITVAAGRNALVSLVDTSTLETSVSLKALSGVVKIIGLGNIGLTLTGNALDNTIVSALGSDTINGGDGTDTVVYSGLRSAYVINTNVATGITTVTGLGATDTLTFVEKLQFSDQIVTIGAPANRAPTVAVADKTVNANEVVKIASWVAYSDPDGNPATQYQIVDKGTAANSGTLIAPNGTVVAAGTTLTVSAADLAKVSIKGGSVAGTEAFEIRAFDGKAWSAWDSFNIKTNAPANRAPVVTIDDKSINVNQKVSVASWLKYSDADGNAAVQYQFVDKFATAGSAFFSSPASAQHAANVVFTVNAADLNKVFVNGATVGGWENMQVRAFDGKDWSAWDTFKVTTLPNSKPVALIDDKTVRVNEWIKITDILKFTDKDGDAATQYQFNDLYNASASAYFSVNGVKQAANTPFTVSAADLANVMVRGGTAAGWENMQVRAHDGKEWGDWDNFRLTTKANAAPVVTIDDLSVSKKEWVQVSTILKATDADGDKITEYQFVDKFAAAGSAYFYTPDNVQHAGNEVFTVKAADLSKVWIRGADVAGWDTMQVRASDGVAWSAWDSFKFTTINNSAPVVSGSDLDIKIGKTVSASSLFKVTDADAGDVMTQYQVFDDNAVGTSGRFSLNNKALAADTTHTIAAADLAKLTFTAGSVAGTDLLWVRAFDGDLWSAWHKFDANTII